jgi:hypothetical protein
MGRGNDSLLVPDITVRPSPDFGGLIRPWQMLLTLGHHTATYKGLAAIGCTYLVVVPVCQMWASKLVTVVP